MQILNTITGGYIEQIDHYFPKYLELNYINILSHEPIPTASYEISCGH